MRAAIKWGLILGAAVCIWTLVIHALGFYTTRIAAGQRADIVATILPIACIVLALRERKRLAPLSFRQAVGTGLVVGLISAPITASFLWWYHHYINQRWMDFIVEHQRATMAAAGATSEAIARMEASQRSSATDGAQLAAALIGSAIVSLAIGLVAGAIMRTRAQRSAA